MKKIERILALIGISAMMLMAACDASVTGDGDAIDGGSDATITPDTSTGGDTSVTDTSTTKVYKFVTIDGSPAKEPDCKATTSPGPDIDAILLYRGGQLIGAARNAVFKEGLTPLCKAENEHAVFTDVEGPVNANESKGYFGLSNGTVEVQIGACTGTPETCDGKGAVVDILPGDEVDVYEVDKWYIDNGKTTAAKCKCLAEDYEVWVGEAAGKVDVSLGKHTGTTSAIKVP